MDNQCFLDAKLCRSLRDTINSSSIFQCDKKYRELFNLLCAVMDRLDTCVHYLNNHCEYPRSEEDFLCFLMFACMLKDGVEELLKNTVCNGQKYKSTEKIYFKECCEGDPFWLSDEECLTDDEFFEHLRAIAFAHPFNTDRNRAIERRMGKQVSPWVSILSVPKDEVNTRKSVGVYFYSTKKDPNGNDAHYVMFSFESLVGYIQSKYEQIVFAKQWVIKIIVDRMNEWRKDTINRDKTAVDILLQIRSINLRRFRSAYHTDEMIRYLQQPLSDKRNEKAVAKYRKYLISRIPDLCDAVETVNFEKQCTIEDEMLSFTPPKVHGNWHYQLEKIYGDLNDENPGDVRWGYYQAKCFQNDFAHKWVSIDTDTMGFTEIRLLVTVACFLEKQEQEGR